MVAPSLYMLAACIIWSNLRGDRIGSFIEPDDSLDLYIDFLNKLNPSDWGNDERLMKLIDNVFHRRGG